MDGVILVSENRMMKYTTKTGQNTGTLKIPNHVQTKAMAIALVALCQNLNSGNLLMKGRNSSSFFEGSVGSPPSSKLSPSVREGSNFGCRKARKRLRRYMPRE